MVPMRIISRKPLLKFWEKHPDAEGPLKAWYQEVSKADWPTWADMKKRYPSADAIGNGRYIFNIKGNNYRLVVLINFESQIVFVKFLGTHSEYDRVNVREVEIK